MRKQVQVKQQVRKKRRRQGVNGASGGGGSARAMRPSPKTQMVRVHLGRKDVYEYLLGKEGVHAPDRGTIAGFLAGIEIRAGGRAVVFNDAKMRVEIATGRYSEGMPRATYPPEGGHYAYTVRGILERDVASRLAGSCGVIYCDEWYGYGAGRGYFDDRRVERNERGRPEPMTPKVRRGVTDHLHAAALAYLRIVSDTKFKRLVSDMERQFPKKKNAGKKDAPSNKDADAIVAAASQRLAELIPMAPARPPGPTAIN